MYNPQIVLETVTMCVFLDPRGISFSVIIIITYLLTILYLSRPVGKPS